ncbi:ABC transporter ATP-binding protein [Oenococcus alcoholitolerans]|uniref:ABC transporter ATP-binding protein n=1 Tax=Oenococcus alcoholitolerans TaxID=931074 RepID=UPI003F6F685C
MVDAVAVEHLSKSFSQRQVLKDLSFKIPQGQTVGLIGPSGTGKTTLIAALLGMIKIDQGKIKLLGQTIPDRKIFSKIGYMAQSDALYLNLTAFDNLEFFGKMIGLKNRVLKQKIKEVLKISRLESSANLTVNKYSGGMKRRLSLAIALLADSKLLILDEPTVGIDPELRIQIWQELAKLKQENKTIILTTHVMDEVEKTDRILMLRDGLLIADGRPSDLKKHYQSQTIEEVFIKAGREKL